MSKDVHDRLQDLIASAAKGSDEAFETLLKLYGPLLQKHIGMYASSFSYGELYAEACEALLDAVLHWNAAGGAGFGHYLATCVRNRLKSFYRAHRTQLPLPLEEQPSEEDCEDDLIRADAVDRLLWQIRLLASELEFRVFSYYFRGYTAAEIAEALGMREKDVTNAKARLVAKLRREADRFSDLF